MMPTKDLTNSVIRDAATEVLMSRGYPVDLDSVTQPGTYQVGSNTVTGKPGNVYGVMIVVKGSAFLVQVIYCSGGVQYQRMREGDKDWGAWYKASLIKVV